VAAVLCDAVAVLAGYLLGSLPFAFIITKLATGKDIRFEGEGNVGARNVLHVAGPIPGLLTLLLDAGKGAAAYYLGHRWGSGDLALYLAGFALMLGHGFPVWLGWRGGKGMGPATGFLLPMWPYAVLSALLILIAARAVIPDFNLSLTLAGAAFPFLTLWEGNDLQGLLFIVFFLGMAGIKKVIDLPHERAMRAKSGWTEGLAHARHTRRHDAG